MKRAAALLLAVLALAGCARRHHRAQLPPPPPPRQSPRPVSGPAPTIDELYGYASWYGNPYHGQRTASGEIYDMNDFTAAHRTLALGTNVEVTNVENGRQVRVRINDRGPFVEGRVIDLSYAAAREIEMIGPGTALVRLNVLDRPAQNLYGVQVGSFRERSNAERLQNQLARRHAPVLVRQEGDLYRVLVGAEPSEAGAHSLAQRLRREHLIGMVVLLR